MSEWKISRIMKENGLESKYRNTKTKNVYTSKNTEEYIKANLYPMLSKEDKEREIWAMDFSEVKIGGRKIYTCGIISINSKILVGLKMSYNIKSTLAKETIEDAVENFGIPYMILTDRGTQFVSKEFHDIIVIYKILHSMSRPYTPVDNCFIETYWKTMKTEIGPVDKYTQDEYMMVVEYYRNYYNFRRPHSSLNYETPIQHSLNLDVIKTTEVFV